MKDLNERRYRVAQKAINKMEAAAKHLRSENDEVFLANGDTVTFPRDVIDFADWVTEKGEDVLKLSTKTLEARWIKFLGVLTGERVAYTPKKKVAAPAPVPEKVKAKVKKAVAKPAAPAPPPAVKKVRKPKKLVKAVPVAAAVATTEAPPAKPKKVRTRASKAPAAPAHEPSAARGTLIPAAGIPMTLKAPTGVKMPFAPTHPIMANLVAAMMLLEAHLEKIQDKPAKADGRRVYNMINDACDKISKMK